MWWIERVKSKQKKQHQQPIMLIENVWKWEQGHGKQSGKCDWRVLHSLGKNDFVQSISIEKVLK